MASSPDYVGPACGEVFGGPLQCTCPFSFEELAQARELACDQSCATCNLPESTCGAYCVRPFTGDSARWMRWCTE